MAATNCGVRCGWTLIRKTSLLHKTDPTALRSSAADVLHCPHKYPARLSPPEASLQEMPGESAPPAASQPRAALGSISSSRCQITRATLDQIESTRIHYSHERV